MDDGQRVPWLLRLPAPLEQQFFQDGSVQRVYTMLDVLAVTQALLLNWHLLRRFGALQQEDSVMMPHERVATAMYFAGALLQMVCMAVWPQQYRVHRQRIALVNRLLRLLLPLAGVLLVTPALAWRQTQLLYSVVGHLPHTHSSLPPVLAAFAAGQGCLSAQSAAPVTAAASMAAAGPPAAANSSIALWKNVLMLPAILMMHANWLVPFWVAVAMQALTLGASIRAMFAGICATVYLWPPTAAILPACQQLNWLLYVVGQLLDWQVPVDPQQASTASDAVCADPVVALVLLQVWVRLVLLVLVPCGLVYCLERSLKVGFLQTRSAGAGAAAAPASAAEHQQAGSQQQLQDSSHATAPPHRVQVGPSSSSTGRGSANGQRAGARAAGVQAGAARQRRRLLQLQQQQLEQALCAVQPVSVRELLSHGPVYGTVKWLVGMGLFLSALLVCWLLCEVVMLSLLRGGRQFVCGADGWLRLQ